MSHNPSHRTRRRLTVGFDKISRMEWTSLASTALGALIALFTTMINDRAKWRREQVSNRRKLHQQTYSAFLTALTEAHERMRSESLAEHQTPQTRSAAIIDVFHEAGCYRLRYELSIVAEQNVLDCGEESFRIMRNIRDLLAGDGSVNDEKYKDLRRAYGASLRELQQRMRVELGNARVSLAGGS
jgi:hypothetical protein